MGHENTMENVAEIAGYIAQVLEEDEEDYEQHMMLVAEMAAAEIMELEEGVGFDEMVGESWVAVTVVINEYHFMGDPCFKLHFRMSRVVFEVLCETVHGHQVETGRLRREKTPTADIMLMVVWILATPDSFRSVALRFGVRPSTLHYFYTCTVETLREIAPRYISWPTVEEKQTIKNTFQRATGFPGVIGSIDCTHIYITAPVENPAHFRNRHHTYSLNVQAVVDSSLLVRHLHVGEVGSMQGYAGILFVFRRSPLCADLIQEGDLCIIEPDEHLVGDGAYTLTDFMMIPFANNGHLTAAQRNFNRRLSQSRGRVENSFARAKGKWRRLKHLHARNQAYVVDHITASFVLHNFTLLHGEPMFEEEELCRPIHDHEVLGDDEIEQEGDEDDNVNHNHEALMEAAQARGTKKALFIMDHILPAHGGPD